MTNEFILRSIFVGACGTAAMDVWAIILNRYFNRPKPNWGLVGRWFLHLPFGFMFHKDIAAEKSFWFEEEAGWVAHYVSGFIYAAILMKWGGAAWIAQPALLPALIVGWVTVGAGWFILQPGMGAGVASSKRENAGTIRIFNLIAHTWFGLGLWIGALILAR